jgi:PAS domain S-box-containing protein
MLNEAMVSSLGYTEDEVVGNDYIETFVVKRHHAKARDVFRETLQKGCVQVTEQYTMSKSGDGRLIEWHIQPIRDGRSRFTMLCAVGIDITAKKKAQEALWESEQKYRNLVETAMVGIYRARIDDGKILLANKAFANAFGYLSIEHLQEDFVASKHYADPRRLTQLMEQLSQDGEVDGFEIAGKRRDGSLVQIMISAKIYPAKGYIEGVLIDTTKIKQAQEALQKSEERYRLLFNNANDAIFIAQDGIVKFPNRKVEEVLGYSVEELKQIPFTELIHPEDRERVVERFIKRLKGHEYSTPHSYRVIAQSGKIHWIQVNAVRIIWEGSPATLNFGRDITDQKQLESQIQRAQKMESIGTLAGGIAHDFNNLLMAIQGNVSLMLYDMNPSHENFKALRNIEQQIKNGAKLCNHLLGYARKGRYEVKPVSLNRLIEETSGAFARTRKDILIRLDLLKSLSAIEVDEGQIEQVLLNMYVNASDAMPGGGELTLATKNVTHDNLREKLYKPKSGSYVCLSVTDTGVGMDSEIQQRIFDPFFTTKEMGRGTGLGLASVYGIIKGHGGYIDVESEKGRGSTFNIYLPASAHSILDRPETPKRLIGGDGTILMVDDEEMVLNVGTNMLKKLGYTVLEAREGKEAIDVYQRNRDRIDLVILDMIMPIMGGGEAYDRIKTIDPDVKVILSSGYSLDGQANEILDRGCDGFIHKPFTMEDLSGKIREIMTAPKCDPPCLRSRGNGSI